MTSVICRITNPEIPYDYGTELILEQPCNNIRNVEVFDKLLTDEEIKWNT